VRPGALAFSFGMLGCDLHCGRWASSFRRQITDRPFLPVLAN
jgi:hypothetical protein